MKKISLMALVVLASATASASNNMESALFGASKNDFYAKTSYGFMQKQQKVSGLQADGITRSTIELGYGITDVTTIRGTAQYVSNAEEARSGFTIGKIGANHRFMNKSQPVLFDFFYDFSLAGALPTKGELDVTGLHYENYSHGRYAVSTGFQVGKEIGKFQTAGLFEVKYNLAGDNNKFDFDLPFGTGYINADLKSSVDYMAALKFSYEQSKDWLWNGSITWKQFGSTSIDDVFVSGTAAAQAMLPAMLKGDRHDGYQELILNAGVAYTVSDRSQIGVYAEYTFDDAEFNQVSGKENDYKYEIGAKYNFIF